LLLVPLLSQIAWSSDAAVEEQIEKLNKNFIGYHIRYRTLGQDRKAVIYTKIEEPRNFQHGIVIVLNKQGVIENVRPLSTEKINPENLEKKPKKNLNEEGK
jgi:hypothetical protein